MANQGGIRNVSLWYDIGYTDGCTEIPPIGHTLRAPDITLQGEFHPAWDRLFSQLEVPETFPDLMKCSYIRMEFFYNNSQDSNLYYGWIDEVVLRSDTQGQPVTWIKWHVDWWRTFNGAMTFGSGYVVRRPSGVEDLWQGYSYRYVRANRDRVRQRLDVLVDPVGRLGDDDILWVVVSYVMKNTDTDTKIAYMLWPVVQQSIVLYVRIGAEGSGKKCPSIIDVYNGLFDERLGLTPDSVVSVWLAPSAISAGFKISGTTVYWSNGDGIFKLYESGGYGCFVTGDSFDGGDPYYLSGSYLSTETSRWAVIGSVGETLGYLPFGLSIKEWWIRYRLSASQLVMEIVFIPQTGNDMPLSVQTDGLIFDMICPTFDVTTNSWSSYYYTGQRQYEANVRNLKSANSVVDNLMSGVMMGALAGGALGTAVPGVGTAIGAIGGALTGMLKSGLDVAVFNDKYQQESDHYHAQQADGISITGDGFAAMTYHILPMLVEIRPDKVSLTRINGMRDVQGVTYGASVEDCTSLITAGGPLQISNLIVHGNIPVQAKNWVRRKFADGVRIIARPTEGEDVEDT